MCGTITRAGNAPALSREIAECRANVVQSIPPGTDPTNDYWRARADQLDREAIARGLNDEAEFIAWYQAEIVGWGERHLHRHEIGRMAFYQGLALGREGRA